MDICLPLVRMDWMKVKHQLGRIACLTTIVVLCINTFSSVFSFCFHSDTVYPSKKLIIKLDKENVDYFLSVEEENEEEEVLVSPKIALVSSPQIVSFFANALNVKYSKCLLISSKVPLYLKKRELLL